MPNRKWPEKITAVVKVGAGRGFVIAHRTKPRFQNLPKKIRLAPFVEDRLIVTAAHCLPLLPPANPANYNYERTFQRLLGPLFDKKTNVAAECRFVDPIADVAVLGAPDGQDLPEEAEAYDSLTEGVTPFLIANATSGAGWVLSLDGCWVRSRIELFSGFGVSMTIDPTEGGQSGSPVLDYKGRAIGLISVGKETVVEGSKVINGRTGPQPILTRNLPGWLLKPLNGNP